MAIAALVGQCQQTGQKLCPYPFLATRHSSLQAFSFLSLLGVNGEVRPWLRTTALEPNWSLPSSTVSCSLRLQYRWSLGCNSLFDCPVITSCFNFSRTWSFYIHWQSCQNFITLSFIGVATGGVSANNSRLKASALATQPPGWCSNR